MRQEGLGNYLQSLFQFNSILVPLPLHGSYFLCVTAHLRGRRIDGFSGFCEEAADQCEGDYVDVAINALGGYDVLSKLSLKR